ncbi:MAG: aminoacyl-tRNA hydrolase [Clostridiales bacterium]|nr:aminoacyl-tRNA hydrolase [Clostridiales bacterium]
MFLRKKAGPAAWIAVFLGNPGTKYNGTRHNVGFLTAGILGKKAGIKIDRLKYKALTGVCDLGGQKVLLMKPQTYMNLSGSAVSAAKAFFKLPLEHIVVVSDDVSLPVGKIRIRRSGSAGGHNGLKDIIEKCGGDNFPRVRIGVGAPPHPDFDMADWVLSTFSDKETKLITEAAENAAAAVEMIISAGIEKAMSAYN